MTLAPEAPVSLDTRWLAVCQLEDLLPGRGACALLDGRQVALFRHVDGRLYAVGNYDPYGKAYVISRGIVGSRADVPTVASPLYKQVFDLRTGRCLDDPDGPALATYPVRVNGATIEVGLQ
jgi:nitrite reductase (NADH) small subunit